MNLDKKQYSLVLTKDFQALDVVGVKKSMKYLCTEVGKAMDPESYQLYTFEEWIETFCKPDKTVTVRTEKLWIRIPEIIVLNRNYVRRKKLGTKALSKRKVFERDGNVCGYCGITMSSKNRTIDHIMPTSRGGSKYDYGNVVACCSSCNSIKSDRTPEEMGWDLLHDVRVPREDNCVLKHVPKSKWLPSWEPYVQS